MTCVTVMHTRHTCRATAVLTPGLLIFLENIITLVTTVDMKSLIDQEWWGYLGGEFKFTLTALKFSPQRGCAVHLLLILIKAHASYLFIPVGNYVCQH